jgi:DNA-binding NarL/FixJ family response regulator
MPFQVEKCTDFAGVIKAADGTRFHVLSPGGTEELTKRIARVLNACEHIPDAQIRAGVAPLAHVNSDPVGTPIVQTALPPGEVKELVAKGCSVRAIAQAFFAMSIEQIEEVVQEIIETPELDPV